MRGLTPKFIEDLVEGELSYFLNKIKENNELCLEIRKNYLNIYYKGGNALRIRQNKNGYKFEFDKNYCRYEQEQMRLRINELNSLDDYKINFEQLLSVMDNWFSNHPKEERRIQQDLIKLNSKDFCIIDIEYAGSYLNSGALKSFRLDMVAIHNGKLVIVENKNGTKAMGGKSDLNAHYNDICAVIDNSEAKKHLLESMKNISKNKRALGLQCADITSDEIEILFLIFNYNKNSKMLSNQIEKIQKQYPAKIINMGEKADKIYYENAEEFI